MVWLIKVECLQELLLMDNRLKPLLVLQQKLLPILLKKFHLQRLVDKDAIGSVNLLLKVTNKIHLEHKLLVY